MNFPTSDAPKHTKIIQSTKKTDGSGMSYVELSCSTQCYPPVEKYIWYKKEKNTKTDEKIYKYKGQNYTVYSNQPGVYFCIAKNEIGEKQSDPVNLFDGE